MLKSIRLLMLTLGVILLVNPVFAHPKLISLTIDDLPFVGEYKNQHLNQIIKTLQKSHVPTTGFIIADSIRPENWKVLRRFREAGFALGNHSLHHNNLNKVDTNTYLEELKQAEAILSPLLTHPKFFRYPYLAEGHGEKKQRVASFLSAKNYHVAPITIDSKDFIFNQLLLSVPESHRRSFFNSLKRTYLDYLWQQTLKAEQRKNPFNGQILLVHANLLNAYALPDIIALYQQKGYQFISLTEALNLRKDPSRYAQRQVGFTESEWEWD